MENDSSWMSRALYLEGQVDLLRQQVEILSKSNFDMVKNFHKTFNKVQDPTTPTVPPSEISILRIRLMCEELQEVLTELGFTAEFKMEAVEGFVLGPKFTSVNLINVAKELADLLYVVYGTAAAFGIDVDAVFEEVHRSNMSKVGEDGKPLYREDGKVLKGPNYFTPDVESILYPEWTDFHERQKLKAKNG
jgi:predicted HAD superfamily Cof-like phosphohydrolase